jgi:hypothetical protein
LQGTPRYWHYGLFDPASGYKDGQNRWQEGDHAFRMAAALFVSLLVVVSAPYSLVLFSLILCVTLNECFLVLYSLVAAFLN